MQGCSSPSLKLPVPSTPTTSLPPRSPPKWGQPHVPGGCGAGSKDNFPRPWGAAPARNRSGGAVEPSLDRCGRSCRTPGTEGQFPAPTYRSGGAACAACSQPLSLPPSPVPGSGGDHGLARSGMARGGVPGAGGSGVEGLTCRLKVRALRSDPFSDSNGFLGALCGVRLHRKPHERAGAASTLGAGKRGRAGGTHRRPHPGWRGPPPLHPADPRARPGLPPPGAPTGTGCPRLRHPHRARWLRGLGAG